MYPSAPAGEGRSGASVNTHRRPSNSTDGWSVGVERLAGTSNRNAVVSEGPMEVKSRAFYPAPCSFDGYAYWQSPGPGALGLPTLSVLYVLLIPS